MTDAPPRLPPRLPPRDIEQAVSPGRSLAPRLAPLAVTPPLIILAVNHHSSGIIGAAIALGIMVLIFGAEIPLILWSQRRRQRERMRNLPHDALYACRGSMAVPGHRFPVAGDMVVNYEGITFTPLRGKRDLLTIGWSEVARLTLRGAQAQPLAGSLVLSRFDGTKQIFVVRSWGGLAEVLARVP